MNPNIDEPERRLIRDAMARLLDAGAAQPTPSSTVERRPHPLRRQTHREIAGGRGRIEALVPHAQTHRSAR